MANEFGLIAKYFTRATKHTELSVGDDAALIQLGPEMELAISADMLVAGTHFFEDVAPYKLGWKALAVNVSDMAAMGATPKWATLAIALPMVDEAWLEAFSQGFFACANQFGVDLVGGDTTRGSLNLSVQIMGEVPKGAAIKRSGAKLGDEVWVSGCLGDGALALSHMLNNFHITEDELDTLRDKLEMPQPRVTLGLALRGIASSAIDISDGLLADLGHILKQSQLAARLNWQAIPKSEVLSRYADDTRIPTIVLAGGDDYELCFTAAPKHHQAILSIGEELGLRLSCIGQTIEAKDNAYAASVYSHDQILEMNKAGYDHFA